ncbi:MAG: alanine--tRNA ligase [Candidatus Pacebacteria bacterium]|nr:alanine--tRNA ligase [Candidatus Paceibacterota bacterium]
MTQQEIREKFIKYFESKGHKAVPSSSLLPSDQSVLFTTAGMQQFKQYYTGVADAQKDFGSLSTTSIQKCIRTSDIDEVGDASHLTFFEMLGNFSFGGYWKKEAIQYAHEFITKEMALTIDYVSVFAGEGDVPADVESEEIWKSIDSNIVVKKFGRADNFWGPTGNEGPCGPTTEIYVNGLEVWNVVFNEYFQSPEGKLEKLKTQGIDTGMGLERLAMVVQDKETIFSTDLFSPAMNLLPIEASDRTRRIIADHLRASTFMLSDSITPSNKEQGYVLRRLLRRAIVQAYLNNISVETLVKIFEEFVSAYSPYYPNLNRDLIVSEFNKENDKFQKTFRNGLKEMEKVEHFDGLSAFKLYESFGLPYEIIKEVGADKAKDLTRESFEKELEKAKEISRAGAEKKFGGHGIVSGDISGADSAEIEKKTRLHTATHVVVAALEKVLGQKLPQAGSDISVERLRFDFNFPRKITPEEIKQAQDVANEVVAKDLPVSFEEMDVDKAFESGASGAFKHKYGSRVKVYSIGIEGNYFSRELCGGPHVTHTGAIGKITITKEESVSGGNRRIRAVVE